MNLQTKEILNKALVLEEKERAWLAHYLIDSLEEIKDRNVEEEWLRLANKRLNEIEDGKVKPVEWKEIRNKITKH